MQGNKNQYYAHDFHKDVTGMIAQRAVLAENFICYKDFADFAKKHGMQTCFCPMNVASKMVSNYKVFKANEYEIEVLKSEINALIHHVERETATYSVLEHARKLVFTHDGPNSVNH